MNRTALLLGFSVLMFLGGMFAGQSVREGMSLFRADTRSETNFAAVDAMADSSAGFSAAAGNPSFGDMQMHLVSGRRGVEPDLSPMAAAAVPFPRDADRPVGESWPAAGCCVGNSECRVATADYHVADGESSPRDLSDRMSEECPAESQFPDIAASAQLASEHRLSRESAAAVIRRYFPGAECDVVEVWADALADLPGEEIHFIMAQKQRLSQPDHGLNPLSSLSHGDLRSESGQSAIPEVSQDTSSGVDAESDQLLTQRMPDEENGDPQAGQTGPAPLQHAVEATLQNLLGVHVPGYRGRHIVLPGVGRVTSGEERMQNQPAEPGISGALTRFDIGPLLETGNPLHLCLPNDRDCFFCLEPGPVLTRRGDFRILADRSVGLLSGAVEYSLAGRIEIPDVAVAVEVTRDATIRWKSAEGQWHSAGIVPVVRVGTTDVLGTDDGVLFSVTRSADFSTAEISSFTLDSRKIELSNVELRREWELLEHFRRLEKELSGR